jgi:hypothetical protein
LSGDHAIANHDAAEWTSHRNFSSTCINCFIYAIEIDASTNLFFHPHAPTATTAAE